MKNFCGNLFGFVSENKQEILQIVTVTVVVVAIAVVQIVTETEKTKRTIAQYQSIDCGEPAQTILSL